MFSENSPFDSKQKFDFLIFFHYTKIINHEEVQNFGD